MRDRICFAAFSVLFFLASTTGFSQGTRETPSPVTLQVTVVYADYQPVDKQVSVRLLNADGAMVDENVTNGEGKVVFQTLSGVYRLEASALGIKKAAGDLFTIYRDEHSHHETIAVEPEKTDDSESSAGAPGTVSAASMNVPEAAKIEFRKGAEALKKNDLSGGENHFSRAISAYPQYSAAYDERGIARAKMGRSDDALKDFEKAVELDDHDREACINLSRLHYQSGNLEAAEEALAKALVADPKDVEALVLMSNLQYRSGRLQDAVATEHKIHSLPHASYTIAHVLAAQAFEAQKLWAEAAEEYELYLKESPNGPSASQVRQWLKGAQNKQQAQAAAPPHR